MIVQQARFADGELLLYERLHMTPFLLERYAKDGTNKSRRQMLAMSQSDPHILADVLGLFVGMATQKLRQENVRDLGFVWRVAQLLHGTLLMAFRCSLTHAPSSLC